MRPHAAVLIAALPISTARADDAPAISVKGSVEKALKRIEQGMINYPKQRQCFSCHHQAMALMSMSAARTRGFEVSEDLLTKVVDFSLRSFRNKTIIARGQGVGGDSFSIVYALHALAAVDRAPDDTTAAMVEYLLVKQRKDGAWPIPAFGDRPPTMGSLFTSTGLAMFALKKYGPARDGPDGEKGQQRIDTAIARGRDWLLAGKPASTEDKVFHLWGLVDAGAAAGPIDAARVALRKEQRSDGSWAQLPQMSGDAYATATVLVALRRAGLETKDETYTRGVRYLLETQKDDGAWIVPTRTRPLQIFFDNGDPGGKSQFISYAATGWAVLALLETVPPVLPEPAPAP
jgi:N-acyl-D-amino-acid deacylase